MAGHQAAEERAGILYVVATPIGNLADITLRALEVLRSVAFVVAEDTRHTRKLLSAHNIRVPVLSCHAHTSPGGIEKIVGLLHSGRSIAVVTDAGTPGISDPGTALIHQALENGRPVVPIPGPSAAITALSVSGLPPQPFAFLGFPPPKGGRRTTFFEEYAALPMTLVLYESPRRLARTLRDILRHWGNRRLAVARELTKVHEEVFRGTVSQAVEAFQGPVRGEITLVVEGAAASWAPKADTEALWKDALAECLARGETVKDAVEKIHRAFKVSRREVYRTALELDRDRD